MIIKIVSKQIPYFWNAIKYTVKEAGEVNEKDFQPYCNELLQALLSDKAQCFVRLDDKRILEAVLITRIMENRVTGEKYLFAQSLYSWQFRNNEVWKEGYDFIVDFARSNGCRYISCQSNNPRAWDIYQAIGMQEDHRSFIHRI